MKIFTVTLISIVIGMGSVQAQHALVFSELQGLSAAIFLKVLQEVYQRLDIPIRGKIYPPARALVMTNEGITDGEVHRVQGMNVITVDTYEQVLRMVAIGRIDIGLTTRVTGLSMLKDLQLADIRIIEPPLLTIELYHYLHKKHADLVPEITQVLHAMKQEGRIQAIRDHIVTELFQ